MSHILIADDDAVQLDLRKGLLQRGGHEVSVAFTAAQVVRAIAERAADLIIMDLRFPNAEGTPDSDEGLALIRRIREMGCCTPLLVLSGWTSDLEGQPEEKMVDRVMLKPVKPSVLMATVREMIA
jgi:two-component system alkaline phosphatase synthesis response regulator PhoP